METRYPDGACLPGRDGGADSPPAPVIGPCHARGKRRLPCRRRTAVGAACAACALELRDPPHDRDLRGGRCLADSRHERSPLPRPRPALLGSVVGSGGLLPRFTGSPWGVLPASGSPGRRPPARAGRVDRPLARVGEPGRRVFLSRGGSAADDRSENPGSGVVLAGGPPHSCGGRVGDRWLRIEGLRLGPRARRCRLVRPRQVGPRLGLARGGHRVSSARRRLGHARLPPCRPRRREGEWPPARAAGRDGGAGAGRGGRDRAGGPGGGAGSRALRGN